MRVSRIVSIGMAVSCLLLASISPSVANTGTAQKKHGRKARQSAAPALPSGSGTPSATAAPYVGAASDTIHEHVNDVGQVVYAIQASHFDVSAPLSEMAANAPKDIAVQEAEGPENPQLPSWRTVRSGAADPVASPVTSSEQRSALFAPAPVMGFNFVGVGYSGLTPSDSNGSIGNNQYVETVNTRYQVWSLDRPTKVATSILGPISINTLWSGFGGPCQSQNAGDPIVVYDKVASRWLISQFTTTAVNGVYYQCVALSTTPNAAGTYNRWAFAVPNNVFGDYPHFGVWSDAYYMMAHAFTSTSGSYVAAIFAAMDRGKMLSGDPGATWQVIFDPNEGGHMPADLDGTAPPPANAPGIFLSLHAEGMFVYRMKVDFVNPGNTVNSKQATVPVAPSNAACGGGSCIPQPGTTTTVGSLADRLMFRAAYRNFVDHEALVISHSVDPSVTGLVSGVRWYDFHLSGSPDGVCSTYPCVYQQGTVADVANGRSRWMPSIAMDAAENILVGYSATGTANGTDNQSIRYTGRAAKDPLGTMTVPEGLIATGTANNTNGRWGDYTSMSVDPIDDCTLWYVGQYFTSAGVWSTRVASVAWPAGTGIGNCPTNSCNSRPPVAPAIGNAATDGDNRIAITWTGLGPSVGSYAIERADGVCGSEGTYRPVAAVTGDMSSYTDTTVLGGIGYSYRVIAASDTAGRCQSLVASGCVSATATGTCNLKPAFLGAESGFSNNQPNCGVNLTWSSSSSACPLTPNLRYNVYRGTVPDFVPSAENRIATCVPGPSYLENNFVASGVTYYYVVRAEDNSTGNGGPCNGGNEDGNTTVVKGTAYGVGMQAASGTWTDGAGDGTSFLQMNVAGAGESGDQIWRFVKTANDAGANHTPGGSYAYRNAGPGPTNKYLPNTCAEMQTPPITASGSTMDLKYWERHQIEYHWDAIAVEYSVNGAEWNSVAAPSNAPSSGCDPADDTTGWEAITCTQNPPINACGYPDFTTVINGPLGTGTACASWVTSDTVTSYAHRCHPITGLNPGDSVQFRWRFSSDPGSEYAGFYLDDIAVTNATLPNTCVPDVCAGEPDGSACNAAVACTTGDHCQAGACQAGGPGAPEIVAMRLSGKTTTTLSWSAPVAPTVYDVVTSTLANLRISGTTSATCLANDLAAASYVDPQPNPTTGNGYYYLVRGQGSCGNGNYGMDSAGAPRAPSTDCP